MATVTKATRGAAASNSWSSPSNALTDNGVYSTCAPAKNGHVTGDWDFAAFTDAEIPVGSTITQVRVKVNWKASSSTLPIDLTIAGVNNGVTDGSAVDNTPLTTDSDIVYTFSTTPSETDLKTAGRIVAHLDGHRGNTNTAVTISADYIEIAVDYTPNTIVAVGDVFEFELAQTLSPKKTKAFGQALETDGFAPDGYGQVYYGSAVYGGQSISPVLIGGGGGTTVPVAQALESDSAQALSKAKTHSLLQVTETDLSQAVAREKALGIAQALETDTSQSVTHSKLKAVAEATEADLAQALARAKRLGTGQASETDAAFALTPSKARLIGEITETETAQTFSSSKLKAIAQSLELDVANAILIGGFTPVGQVLETDSAMSITPTKLRALAQVLEAESATALAKAKTKVLLQALETELAQSIAVPKIITVHQVVELDEATGILALHTFVLSPESPTSLVLSLESGDTLVLPVDPPGFYGQSYYGQSFYGDLGGSVEDPVSLSISPESTDTLTLNPEN